MRVETSAKNVTRYEFRVPSPVYGKDMFDALRMAQEAGRQLGRDMTFDDALTCTPEDDGIVVWFEDSAPAVTGRAGGC